MIFWVTCINTELITVSQFARQGESDLNVVHSVSLYTFSNGMLLSPENTTFGITKTRERRDLNIWYRLCVMLNVTNQFSFKLCITS